MGVHDHHIRAPWDDLVATYERCGDAGFDGDVNLLDGVSYESSFSWSHRSCMYHLSDFVEARVRKGGLNSSEEALVRFVQAASPHLYWPERPPSDLETRSAVVFKPDRVRKISEVCQTIDLEQALESYGAVEETERIAGYLETVFSLWASAAEQGEGVVFTEF